MATTYRIHPAIGIARLGNAAPSERGDHFFLGPENDDTAPLHTYKTSPGIIRKQAARFRVFRFEDGKCVGEVTPSEAKIVWKVRLVNRKAAYPGLNSGVPENRLVIDAGDKSIAGPDQPEMTLAGTFQGKGASPKEVVLGSLRTDDQGRLIVLGGAGKGFSPTNVKPITIRNKDWCDDTADGPVTAQLEFADGRHQVEAQGAWVITAMPDYAPPARDAISLYDTMYQVALDKFNKVHYDPLLAAGKVSFRRHVYPLLERVARMWWTSENWGKKSYLDAGVFEKLKSNSPDYIDDRTKVLDDLQAVFMDADAYESERKAFESASPKAALPSELAQAVPFHDWQKKVLTKWANGEFESDFEVPLAEEPWLTLDKAALASCRGNGFGPGVEAAEIVSKASLYGSPFRIDTMKPEHKPGCLTLGLGVPWQADFFQICTSLWPPRRPVEVFRGTAERKPWDEGVSTGEEGVKKWATLGFVLPSGENWDKDRTV